MTTTPAISLIMAVYNGEEHLAEAMDSILAQSFTNFECIVVDDASSDSTPVILAQYAEADSRVKVLRNYVNRERSFSRNRAIQAARAQLVAVADADDWLHPDRLQKQYDFMQQNQHIGVCGSWISVYETGQLWQWPASDAAIRAHMLFNSPIAHPTVIFRKTVFQQLACGYDERCILAEDYDLWERLSRLNVVFANIPDALLRYRLHPQKDRSAYRDVLARCADAVRLRQIQLLGLEPDNYERTIHSILSGAQEPNFPSDVRTVRLWKNKLLAANMKKKVYGHTALSEQLQTLNQGLVRRLLWHRGRGCWRKYSPDWLQRSYRWIKPLIRGS